MRYAVFLLLLSASLAKADETCNLQRAAVLDSKIEGSSHVWLPATFDGKATRLLLDTGGGWSVMRAGLAKQLGLTLKTLRTLY